MNKSKPLFILTLTITSLFAANACNSRRDKLKQIITIGMVHYQPIETSDIQLNIFEKEIERQLPNVDVQLSGTTNYSRGAELICQGKWDISFALSPIVSAQAIDCGHIPLFQAYGGGTYYSALFVRSDSPLAQGFKLKDLADKSLALNQVGSASGFYFPLYELRGATLAKVGFLGDYDKIKSAVIAKEYDIGVAPSDLMEDETLFPVNSFKIIARSIDIPQGVILINPNLSSNLQRELKDVLSSIDPKALPQGANEEPLYVTTAPLPNFDKVVEVVKTIDAIGDCYAHYPAQIKQCDVQAAN